jgi:PDDEXK-like domain of unknown function (DUF3799)
MSVAILSESATGLWDVPSNAAYHMDEAVSHSRLEIFRSSPIEFQARFITGSMPEPEPTPSLILGEAFHATILEPEQWDSLFAIEPLMIDGRTKEGRATKALFKETSAGKTIVTRKQYESIVKMAQSALAHPEVAEIMTNAWRKEQGVRAVHTNGLPLRSKIDVICNGALIADFKTAADVSPDGFARACANFGYHRQGAFYIDVAKSALGRKYRFVNIAVQNQEPWETACYYLDNSDIELGREQNNFALDRLKQYYETDEWRGPQNIGIVKLKLPKWAHFVD